MRSLSQSTRAHFAQNARDRSGFGLQRALAVGIFVVVSIAAGPDVFADKVADDSARVSDTETVALAPVTINPIVRIDDDYIRLGDLFDPLDRYSDRIVMRAPAPGEELTLPAVWLWKAARTFGIDWRPVGTADQIVVSRPASTITDDMLQGLLLDAYFRRTGEDDLVEVEPTGGPMQINLPMSVAPTARIERFDYDPRSGRYTATVVAPADGRALMRQNLSGRFHRLVELPVPTRRLGRGHVIAAGDIELMRMRDHRLPSNLIVDADLLIGQSVHQSLSAGKPVRDGAVRPPVLVQKDRKVLVTLQTNRMQLTVQGRAMEDGAMGDIVRIQNTASRLVIDAEVVGEGNVVVTLPTDLAMGLN